MTGENQESAPLSAEPFFSIIVPTWNRAAMAAETIRTLVEQDFPQRDYETIVVDDGSTDDTQEQLRGFGNRIRVFQQPNAGPGPARNTGIKHARGQYLVFVDHDDLLSPDALTVYKRVIDAFERPPIVLAKEIKFRTGQEVEPAPGQPSNVTCVKCRDFFRKTIQSSVTNSIFVVSRDIVLRAGCYSADAASHEDHDLLFRLGTASPMVKIVSPATVAIRLHERNVTNDLTFVSRGTVALIRRERQGAYPGGWRRMLDRRGLIGTNVLTVCYYFFWKRRQMPRYWRFLHIVRLVLYARGMVLAALVRRACSRFYSQEVRTLDGAVPVRGFAASR